MDIKKKININFFILSAVLTVPLCFNPLNEGAFLSIKYSFIIFTGLVLLFHSTYYSSDIKRTFLKIFFFVFVLLLTGVIKSISINTSIKALLVYSSVCIICLNLSFLNQKNKNKILFFFLFSAFICSIYGISQHLGFDIFAYLNFTAWKFINMRLFSFFGNQNAVADFLCFFIGPGLLLFIFSKSIKQKIILFMIFLSIFICMILTLSRAGWVGSVVAFFYCFFILLKKLNKKKIIIYALIILIVLISFIGLSNYKKTIFQEIQSFKNFKQDSNILFRLLTYNTIIINNYQNYFSGFGFDSFQYLNPYISTPLLNKYISETTTKRAHNDYFQFLSEAGILFLCFYLSLLFFILFKKNKTFFQVILTSGIIGFMACSFFSFNLQTPSPLFAFAVFTGLFFNNRPKIDKPVSINFFYIFISIVLCIFLNFDFLSDAYLSYAKLNKVPVKIYSKIKNNLSFEYKEKFNIYILSLSKNSKADLTATGYFNFLFNNSLCKLDHLKLLYSISVNNHQLNRLILTNYLSKYPYKKILYLRYSDFFKSPDNIIIYKKDFSVDADFFGNLSGLFASNNQNKKSIFYNRLALKTDPNNAVLFLNQGVSFLLDKNYSKAEYYFKKSISLNKNLTQSYINLGALYLEIKDYKNAYLNFKQAEKLEPNNEKVKNILSKFSIKKIQ